MTGPTIRNPNYRQLELTLPALPAAERDALRLALASALSALPADQPRATIYDLAVTARASLHGQVDPASFDGDTLAELLAEMGYEEE
jgi:hypothetical protein